MTGWAYRPTPLHLPRAQNVFTSYAYTVQEKNLLVFSNGELTSIPPTHLGQFTLSIEISQLHPDPMDAAEFRTAAHSAIEEIIAYYDSLPEKRVLATVSPGYLAPLLPTSAPQEPESWKVIQPDIEKYILPGLTHWQSPNFMAFFPACATYPSMLGEMYSAAFTAPAFNWLCSPAFTELETIVLDWLARMMGLPECFESKGEGGGVIQGSASEAVVVAMVAARERALSNLTEGYEGEVKEDQMDALRGKLVALGSEQAHSSTQKGAQIAGTKHVSIKTSAVNHFAMTGRDLRRSLDDITARGRIPYYLTVTLGTTATCAVDNFAEIVEVLKDYPQIWVHVDAAYAGAALICPEYQHHAKSFDRFDSFAMNMHKWLLVNFDANCMFIRRRRDLTSALSITRSYLSNDFSDRGLVTDYRDWQIPLGRRFRALKIWFVMRTYGVLGMQAHIRKGVELGKLFASLVETRKDLFRIVEGPSFGLVVFTVVGKREFEVRTSQTNGPHSGVNGGMRPSTTAEIESYGTQNAYSNDFTPDAAQQMLLDANAVTKEVYTRINARGPIYLTSGVVGGTYAIRLVSTNSTASEEFVKGAFEVIVDESEKILRGAN
ncbi:dopa decarboxylase-like protein [Pseudovirgaria hyperparasitica]|uniref:Dopa decarboxylase-like protein n=1 Tax=Pseudovirgaria hyperparasitica TaxID=470096 RepID=A0A6A6VPQ5_9PEZI|nr:dopa decarboxylase-like protein [Pseudovirgaria hyperparasitica]KAF2752602.1 dopa decarboxylase-like protein [Pseudovirgaria hyperparasitica]